MRLALLLSACGLLAAAPLAAQGRPLRVDGQRDLVFGILIPGLPSHIARTDPINSGQLEVSGVKFSQVQLQFSLPAQLVGPGGATLPLSFGASDAGWSPTRDVANQVGFDPRTTFLTNLPNNGKGTVFLGGTARPQPSQRAGSYSAAVVLTVAYTGS